MFEISGRLVDLALSQVQQSYFLDKLPFLFQEC